MKFTPRIPFLELLGMERLAAQDGLSEIRLDMREDLENHLQMAHGGVLMTLLDVAMAQAARSAHGDALVITVELKTSFMQASRGTLTARGSVLHRTARTAFAQASVFDADGKHCAHATGTFKYLPAAKA